MKILYFNYMSDLYGSAIGSTIKALKILKNLEQYGHQVTFHWRNYNKKVDTGVVKSPAKRSKVWYILRMLLYTPKEILKNALDLYVENRLIRKTRPDLIIVRLDAFHFSSIVLAKIYNIKLLIEADSAMSYEWLTFFGGPHIWPFALKSIEKIVLKLADGIFAQSQVTKDYLATLHNVADEKIKVITNGADIPVMPDDTERTTLCRQLGFPPEAVIIGFLGSMHYWHGVTNLQEMIANILTGYPRAHFLFIGSGGAQANFFKNKVTGRNNGRIVFLDSVDHAKVYKYLHIFEIALAPYQKLALFYYSPVKIFEYMAAGKAIVTSRIGQIEQVIEDGKTGLLCEPGNYEEMESKIKMLLDDREFRKTIGANAKNAILQKHTWNLKSRELDSYISKILEIKR